MQLRVWPINDVIFEPPLYSSGTSKIGNCGGIDNPTHYTRLKKLLPFILHYVDDKDHLCFSDGEEKEEKKNVSVR